LDEIWLAVGIQSSLQYMGFLGYYSLGDFEKKERLNWSIIAMWLAKM